MRLVGVYGNPRRPRVLAAQRGFDARVYIHYSAAEGLKECPGSAAAVLLAPRALDPGEGVVDAWGRRGLFAFANSGCIRGENVRSRFLEVVENLASRGCGIVVDVLRYPSPHDGRLMLSCFCEHCLKAGLSLEALRRELLDSTSKRDPQRFAEALQDLSQARAEAVEELALETRDKTRAYGAALEAAVFPRASRGSWARGSTGSRGYTIGSRSCSITGAAVQPATTTSTQASRAS